MTKEKSEGEHEAKERQLEAERERDEAEDRFQAVFDVNPAPAMIVRLADERIVRVNSGFPELTEYGVREVRHKTLDELELFSDVGRREDLLESPRRGKPLSKAEVRLRARSGEEKVALVSVKPLELGEERCAIFTFADITEQKRAEERFSSAFRLAPIPTCMMTPQEGRFVDVNRSFLELTGYAQEEVLGRTSRALGIWASAEDRTEVAALREHGDSFRDLELSLRTKAGETRDVLASAEVLEGDPPLMLMMFHDVTARKRTEVQLMQAISEVMQDTAWFSRSVMERLAQVRSGRADAGTVATLTNREREVLECVAGGMGNEAIAAELGLAKQTVRNYLTTVYSKIGVGSRAEAVVWARERGLVKL